MSKDLCMHTLIILIVFILIALQLFGVQYAYKLHADVFRLSRSQIQEMLPANTTSCTSIPTCTLLPGDILIRRYLTERTWLMDALADPYFTHTAFYVGDGKIVEAVGREKNPSDEIQVTTLSQSDWYNVDVDSWVVVRPRKVGANIETLRSALIRISEDNQYTFGLPGLGKKQYTCADLILSQLAESGYVSASDLPNITSPDYLFWLTARNPSTFSVIGHNIIY